MARFLVAVRQGEAAATRPLEDAEDEGVVTVDGYDSPAALLDDPRFETDASIDGLAALEVLTVEGDSVGPGRLDGSERVIDAREVARMHAGAWLAAQAREGTPAVQRRAVEMLEGAARADAFRQQGGGDASPS